MVRRNWSVTIIQSHCSLSQPNAWKGVSTLLCTNILCPFSVIGNMDLGEILHYPTRPLFTISEAKAWDEGPQIDVVFLDLAEEFEQVPQNILSQNPCNFGISGSSLSWCADYLSNCQQKVVTAGVHSWLHSGPSIFYFHKLSPQRVL